MRIRKLYLSNQRLWWHQAPVVVTPEVVKSVALAGGRSTGLPVEEGTWGAIVPPQALQCVAMGPPSHIQIPTALGTMAGS